MTITRNVGFISLNIIAAISLLGCKPPPTASIESDSTLLTAQNPIWPALDVAIKPNEQIEERIVLMLSTMTLEQKVAQIIQPEIRDITVEDMRRYGFGSYLNGGGAFPNDNKHATVEEWVQLAEQMYQASIDDSLDGSTIPTMWGTDAVHGHNNVIGATLFPHNIGLGATRNPALIEQIAAATAREVMATGIDWIFAPTVATARDNRWGRTYESYSEDPKIVKAYAEAIVTGLQGIPDKNLFGDDKVISTVKHFIGDGGTEFGDDQGNNIDSEQALFDIHAQGYIGGLNAGAQSVMASFNSWHDEKIHGSKKLLTEVLKEKMAFDGFVVGDWNGHGQVEGCTNETCSKAINAGLDMFMVPTKAWKPLLLNTIEQVESGEIPLSRLNDAVSRILRVKLRAGLFEKPSPANRPLVSNKDIIGAQAHRTIAAQAVRESLVLLKNNNSVLPINPTKTILVTGDGANNIGKQSGGWTITWQGTGNTNADFPNGTSIYDGIKKQVELAGGKVELSVDGKFSQKPDVAIVVYGEEPYAEGSGDLDNLEFQRGNKRDVILLKKLKSQDIPVVSVFLSGRPMWVNAELNQSDAFVAAWLPGSEGHAVADLLLSHANGDIQNDFVGKLGFSWPKDPNQGNLNRENNQYDPLFAYDFGLSVLDSQFMANDLVETYDSGNDSLRDISLFNQATKHPWILAAASQNTVTKMTSNTLIMDNIQVRTIDRVVQEDSLQISWLENSETWFGIMSVFEEDLRAYIEGNAVISFDYKTDIDIQIDAAMNCAGICENPYRLTLTNTQGDWNNMAIPMNCLQKDKTAFAKVAAPILLKAVQPSVISVSDIKIHLPEHTNNSTAENCQ